MELTDALHPGPKLTPGVPVRYHSHVKNGKTFARLWLGNRKALAVGIALWPHIVDTDKGDQLLSALVRSNLLEYFQSAIMSTIDHHRGHAEAASA